METNEPTNPNIQTPPIFSITPSHEAKLTQLLRNITSVDIQLCSESSKEFITLLKSETGGTLLKQYIQTSPKCSELLNAWSLRCSKGGLSYIMSLLNVMLSHRDGLYNASDIDRISLSRALDKLARLVLEEKMDDVYKEMNGKESRAKNAALLLLGSVVRRGSGLAADVAKSFNFKMPGFLKLAEYDKRRRKDVVVKRKGVSTRRAFIRFAMSFLEVGDTRLLRWVLQQKEMFSGVLRGLGSDEDETVGYVLGTLRDKVLVKESLVGVGLRSVLFGSVTLEQLVEVSGRGDGGEGVEVAKKVLFMVCTDSANGLMPDAKASLKGNVTRLLGVMKKLKATEIEFHRDLLLGIVYGRPTFGSAYLDDFPYNLDDPATWFAAVSLAANLISSVNAGLSYEFLDSQPHEPTSLNSPEVQSIIKCIGPRTFNRIVINKGLLHSDSHIQHGTLRLVLESLKLLDSLFSAIRLRSKSNKKNELKWMSLKQDIQNEVQLLLPDHQVLLSLISSHNNRYKSEERTLKRGADKTVLLENKRSKKKLKTRSSNEETDILVGGISSSLDDIMTTADNGEMEEDDNVNEVDNLKEESRSIVDLWESHDSNNLNVAAEDEELYFYSKLLDALKVYHRTMPSILEGSFDFFKVLPSNALSLPTILQQSVLSLLVEHIGWSSKQDTPVRFPALMYKHLTHFINLVVNSPVKDIKDQAYVLAQAAMLSSGAFDNATSEINAWLLFLPGFSTESTEESGIETTQNLSSVVVSFFCDVVSTVGNNLFKYWDLLRSQIHRLENMKDVKFQFGPLFVCVLEKCARLLGSESGTFTLPEKSMISMYVSNTLRYLLQTQVEAGLLSSLIRITLSDRLEHIDGDFREWRPLKSLLHFSRSVTDKESCMLSPVDRKRALNDDDSFVNRLGEFTSLAESEHNPGLITAFSSSMLSASPDLILQHFPAVISISKNLGGVPFSILLSICFLERGFLNDVFKSWPELSFLGLERVVAAVHDQSNGDSSSMDSTKFEAFSYFLNKVPFYVLFPAIVSTECLYLSESAKLQNLLLAKLSQEISDNFVCSFRLVFFWLHHTRSSYCDEPAEDLVKISGICFVLIKSMLAHPSASHYVQEIAETIFCHPAVVGVVESPLSANSELKDNIFEHLVDDFLCSAKEGIHTMDYHLLQVLEIFCNQFSLSNDVNKRITRAFKCVIQKLVLMLKNRFDQFIESKDPLPLIPTLFAIYTLVRFISPQELLELAYWMFSRIDLSSVHKSSKISALSVALNVAGCAFDFMQDADIILFEKVYFHVVEIASCSELLAADVCLLKAVKIVNTRSGRTSQSLPQSMVMSRVVASTPMNLLSKCLKKPSTVKSQLLFHLTELSLIHLSFFGLPFMEMVNKSSVGKKRKTGVCDEDLVMLLPTALSFLSFISIRYGDKCYKHVGNIHSLYWDILSDGISNWKNFVSRDLFHVTLDKSVPSTVEELCVCFDTSLLGRSVGVMQRHLVSSGATVKRSKRLKLFDAVIPSATDNLLDCNALEINDHSIDQSLNLVMKVVAKVRLCKMLLFAKGESEVSSLEVMSNKEQLRSVLLINTLISTWRLIVKKFSSKSTSQSEVEGTKFSLFRLLEIFLSKIFVEVITEMHKNSDTESNSAVKLEQLAKSCLLHRFEDSATLTMLQNVLTFDTEDKSLHIQILQLLLAHSQFAPTIQSASKSSSSVQFGIIFRPMSSILRSLTFASTDHKSPPSELYMKQLKLVKLLGVLCHFRAGFEQDIGINTKELMFLLLSSYGATVSEKDMEIYKIMQELERVEESSKNYIGDMDYLWGAAATRVRKVRETENVLSSDDADDIEKHRKSQFRENLPIDPRMCAATVLHFPYDRSLSSGALSCNKLTDDIAGHVHEVYDPVFILRMSLHGLSMDYIEPIEYANLGLLAVAFVSLSSPDEEIRKLGYKVLAVFRDALEVSLKRKEVNRLRPLLNYVQNGISEAWQRIPSVHAIFAAEASVLLLDPSNNHYKTITKLLLHSPMNTKMVSFFDEFFWSNSVDFKSDRIWILRLLYSGLNLEDDAQIYARSSTLEKLLSFYSSPFSDNESRELILQVVKKSLKFDKTSRYLIEHCGVISWLSSLISSFCSSTHQEQKGVLQSQLAVILEVANIVVTSRNTDQWLETRSVEQLTQLSCHLYALFVDNFELVKEIHSVDSILEVISSTLMLSQNRDAFQPHFTFSVEGLYELSQAIDVNCNAELGLKVVLMSAPQAAILNMDQEKLQKFVLWAASVALQSDEPCEQNNDSLLSKLLRWLTASVILARPSRQLGVEESKHNLENTLPKTLQSFLETEWSASRMTSGSEEVLAATIYYLQQIIGRKCEVITSVVTSLCLLLFPDSSHTSELTSLLSRIHCPFEVNPLWRWSFKQPWKDVSTVSESVDDFQACQSLLLVVSNILGKKSSLSHFLSDLDLENSGVLKWERSLVADTL